MIKAMKNNKRMLPLIDGDIIAYLASVPKTKNGVVIEEATAERTHDKVYGWMATIFEYCSTNNYILMLSDKENYRTNSKESNKEGEDSEEKLIKYKANRGEKPEFLRYAIRLLEEDFGAITIPKIEADDIQGILATQYYNNDKIIPAIVTRDKDLNTVAGLHINPINISKSTNANVWINKEEAYNFFWYQMLVGDTVDNIPGVRGIGPAKATKLLDSVHPSLYPYAVHEKYVEVYGDSKMFHECYKHLYILKSPEDYKYMTKLDFPTIKVQSFGEEA